ncbi:helicase [Aureococcus anophagefferens]|uniref:RNA helicase n=1 Tax=Aureococcus anophagefferens TaxID=44056 RepID=A0ABR1G4L2_AURAN
MAKLCAVACLLSVASSFVVPRSARSQTLVVRSKTYDEETDVNVLMTALNAAVAREDFREASSCKKRLDALRGGAAAAAPQAGDWEQEGAPRWLQRRLRDLGMRFPTPVQAAAVREVAGNGGDCVIAAPTGSGKTLAFLVPLLGAVEGEMMRRERRQLEASSNLGLLTPAAAMAAFSPALWTSAQVSPPSRPPQFGPRRGAPLALVLAPSRALAVQLATATFSLVGGTNRNKGSYFPGDKASLFAYEGPKGARVVALASDGDAERAVRAARSRRDGAYKRALADGLVFDEGRVRPVDETQFDDLEDCDVLALGAPDLFDASALRLVAVDEADAIAREARDVLDRLGDPPGAAPARGRRSATARRALPSRRPARPSAARAETAKLAAPASLDHRFMGVEDYRLPLVLARSLRAGPGGLGRRGSPPRGRAPSSSRATRPARARSRTRCARRSGAPTPWRRCCRRRAARPSRRGGVRRAARRRVGRRLRGRRGRQRGDAARDGAVGRAGPRLPQRVPRLRRRRAPGDGRDAKGDLRAAAGRCGRVGQAARGVVTTLGGDDDRAALEGVLRDHFEGVEVADAAPPPSLADEPLPGAGADADAQRAYLEDVLALRDVDDGGGD